MSAEEINPGGKPPATGGEPFVLRKLRSSRWTIELSANAEMGEVEDSLLRACKRLAQRASPSQSNDILETSAHRFFVCAQGFVKRMNWLGADPNAVVEAVEYAEAVLATPQVGSDTRWLEATLDALLEPLAPCRDIPPRAVRFLSRVKAATR
jgi:hypothetical protein